MSSSFNTDSGLPQCYRRCIAKVINLFLDLAWAEPRIRRGEDSVSFLNASTFDKEISVQIHLLSHTWIRHDTVDIGCQHDGASRLQTPASGKNLLLCQVASMRLLPDKTTKMTQRNELFHAEKVLPSTPKLHCIPLPCVGAFTLVFALGFVVKWARLECSSPHPFALFFCSSLPSEFNLRWLNGCMRYLQPCYLQASLLRATSTEFPRI